MHAFCRVNIVGAVKVYRHPLEIAEGNPLGDANLLHHLHMAQLLLDHAVLLGGGEIEIHCCSPFKG